MNTLSKLPPLTTSSPPVSLQDLLDTGITADQIFTFLKKCSHFLAAENSGLRKRIHDQEQTIGMLLTARNRLPPSRSPTPIDSADCGTMDDLAQTLIEFRYDQIIELQQRLKETQLAALCHAALTTVH